MITDLHILDTGYCWASEHHVIRDGSRTRIACHCLVGLIHHSQHGWILFDTGYAPQFHQATRRFPFQLYRWITEVHSRPEQSAAGQLARFHLEPRDIRSVVISHFHADHVAGLSDFPDARIFCTRDGYEHFHRRSGFGAVRKGYIPELVPADLPRRSEWISEFESTSIPGLGGAHDLFGDGSLQLVALPGHARGQIGALLRHEQTDYFLAADGCWQRQSYLRGQPPHWITHLLVDDVNAVQETLDRIGEFHRCRPNVNIIPCHCPEAYREHVAEDATGRQLNDAKGEA